MALSEYGLHPSPILIEGNQILRFSGSPLIFSDDAEQTWVQILRQGTWNHPKYGKFTVNKQVLQDIKANFDADVRGQKILVDEEHVPEKGSLGVVRELSIRKGDLWAKVDWTVDGQEVRRRKSHPYVSPEIAWDWKDPETGQEHKHVLNGFALTTRPFIKRMQPVVDLSEGETSVITLSEEGGMNLDEPIEAMLLCMDGMMEDRMHYQCEEAVRTSLLPFQALLSAVHSAEDLDPEQKLDMAKKILSTLPDQVLNVFALALQTMEGGMGEEVPVEMSEQMWSLLLKEWDTQYVNDLPDSAFAVIEPAYKQGKTDNKNARHLPIKNAQGELDLPHYRNALARVNQIKPVTDSISKEDLIKKAQAVLDKHRDELKMSAAEKMPDMTGTPVEDIKKMLKKHGLKDYEIEDMMKLMHAGTKVDLAEGVFDDYDFLLKQLGDLVDGFSGRLKNVSGKNYIMANFKDMKQKLAGLADVIKKRRDKQMAKPDEIKANEEGGQAKDFQLSEEQIKVLTEQIKAQVVESYQTEIAKLKEENASAMQAVEAYRRDHKLRDLEDQIKTWKFTESADTVKRQIAPAGVAVLQEVMMELSEETGKKLAELLAKGIPMVALGEIGSSLSGYDSGGDINQQVIALAEQRFKENPKVPYKSHFLAARKELGVAKKAVGGDE